MYGTEIPRSEWIPRQRAGIGAIESTPNGENVAIRIGREIDDGSGAWEQVAYVVLTPREAAAVMGLIARAIPEA